jgi:DNA-binding response OmpR family regulator
VLKVLREYLLLRHGRDYEVESIEYCDDALTMLLDRPFALVLLLSLRAPWRTWPSLSVPTRRISGESAILFLKQMRGLHNPVPVLLVSGSSRPDLEAEALANGAFAVIPKPIILAELEPVLDAVLRPGDQGRRQRG